MDEMRKAMAAALRRYFHTPSMGIAVGHPIHGSCYVCEGALDAILRSKRVRACMNASPEEEK
jgi:hypothetical protein